MTELVTSLILFASACTGRAGSGYGLIASGYDGRRAAEPACRTGERRWQGFELAAVLGCVQCELGNGNANNARFGHRAETARAVSGWLPGIPSSGFQLSSGPGATTIFIESHRIDECMAYYQQHGLSHIAVIPFRGFTGTSLDFLRDYPEVRGIALSDAAKIGITGLRFLEQSLKDLGVGDNRQALDLSRFPKLEVFSGDWHPKLRISDDCTSLRGLYLSRYRPKSKNLTELADLPALEQLALVQSPLTSIEGIGRFGRLTRLELAYLTKLESVAALEELADGRLDFLHCDVCKKIRDHGSVTKVPSLRVVRFNGGGEIPSIGFLDDLPHLEEFRFVDTNVIDGDLRPLLRLKSVGFFNKKHYSHTPEQVDALIAGGADLKLPDDTARK